MLGGNTSQTSTIGQVTNTDSKLVVNAMQIHLNLDKCAQKKLLRQVLNKVIRNFSFKFAVLIVINS